jgi:hypothetical protein
MTETEWLEDYNRNRVLFVTAPWMTVRKLRLYAVACCRRIEPLLVDERSRHAVWTAEQMADGRTVEGALGPALYARKEQKTKKLRYAAEAAAFTIDDGTYGRRVPVKSELNGVRKSARMSGKRASEAFACAEEVPVGQLGGLNAAKANAESTAQARLLRDIFGNPFRPVGVDPAWLTWTDGLVLRLARSIYDDRAFDCLPILADALEDAGCENADLLAHCRQPGEHVRGCWVVDLLLGKS